MPNSVGLEVEEVDIFQFANVPFTINAYFKDVNTNMIRTGETSNLKVLLAFEGNASSEFRCKEHHPNLLEVVSNTGIQDNGRAKIVVKIKDVSMNHDHKRFVVYLEAYRPQGNNNIIGAITNPITTINYKLMITESYSAPYIWYKDEGAKDKCIKVNVKLVDATQQVVTNRQVPLTVNLVYSSGQIVQPNTVLTIFHEKESKTLSIGESGTETVKFRVNEVSRNHRKQLFHLLVAADISTDQNISDISPATSIAFEVKSKRSSDARKEQQIRGGDEDSSDENLLVVPPPNRPTASRDNANGPVVQSSAPTSSSAITSAVTTSSKKGRSTNLDIAPSTPNPVSGSLSGNAPIVSSASISSAPHSSTASIKKFTTTITPTASQAPSGTENPILAQTVSSSHLGLTTPTTGVLEDFSLDTPFKALFSLADWTNIAARILSELKSRQDGSVNDAQDATIHQLIDTYPVRAQSCLQYLQQFLSMQEQHLLQQHTLIGALHQQQLAFFHTLDSLNPVRANGTARVSSASSSAAPSMLGMRPTTVAMPSSAISGMSSLNSLRGLSPAISSTVAVPSEAFPQRQLAPRSGPNSGSSKSNSASTSRKRSLDAVLPSTDESTSLVVGSSAGLANELSSSENMVTLIIAKRVALSENTDDFGIPAYTTNTPNGVSLLGFYKEMFDTVRDEKVWVFRPLQSYDIFNDNDINLALIEEILELLENPFILQDGLFFEIRQFKEGLPRMRQEAFMKLARFEQSRGGLSIVFLDKLMQKGSK